MVVNLPVEGQATAYVLKGLRSATQVTCNGLLLNRKEQMTLRTLTVNRQ